MAMHRSILAFTILFLYLLLPSSFQTIIPIHNTPVVYAADDAFNVSNNLPPFDTHDTFFSIHIGSYKNDGNAVKEVSRLEKTGRKAFTRYERVRNRGKLHRVYVGKYGSKKEAENEAIRFGSGRLWNPLDILNPISPTFVESGEDQKGTDALRLEYYPGISTEIALVYAPKRLDNRLNSDIFANKNTNIIGRVRTTIGDTDIAVLGGRATRKNLIGIDIATILWDGMLRGSLVYLSPDAESSYFISSAGYEYTFSNGLYTLVEGFYNQNALNRNNALAQAYNMSIIQGLNEELYAKLSDQFLTANRYYLGIALGYEISPLLRGELFTISDIDGRGVFLSPSLTYNLLQNLDISISGMFGYIFEDVSDVSDFKEFSEHPLLNASLKWYF